MKKDTSLGRNTRLANIQEPGVNKGVEPDIVDLNINFGKNRSLSRSRGQQARYTHEMSVQTDLRGVEHKIELHPSTEDLHQGIEVKSSKGKL